MTRNSAYKAILSDSHFWVPVAVLVIGILLLALVR
ncbi:MAG: translocated intimin receptor Tir [Acidobacteria bacterium]|nr:translocated intimin receptor Tir [Acidobacteriota bacterium]